MGFRRGGYSRRAKRDTNFVMAEELNKAFRELRKEGYYAKRKQSCCGSCSWYEIDEKGRGDKCVFTHLQSDGIDECYLYWAGDGKEIVRHLLDNGLAVKWDGTETNAIRVSDPDDKLYGEEINDIPLDIYYEAV